MKEVISKDLIIIGTGGVGRETALIVEEINSVNKERKKQKSGKSPASIVQGNEQWDLLQFFLLAGK